MVQKGMLSDIFHLVHSPNAHNNQIWVRPKPRARKLRGRTHVLGSSHFAFQGRLAGRGIRSERARTQTGVPSGLKPLGFHALVFFLSWKERLVSTQLLYLIWPPPLI